MIPVSKTASSCGIRIFLHKLSDRSSFDTALQNIDLKNETAEGYTLDQGDVVGRAVGRFVLAGADESEDLIAFSFWSLQADRSVIMNESKADLDPKDCSYCKV